MMSMLRTCAIVAGCFCAATLNAQDTTVKSKTKIKTDDAKVITLTGCLQEGAAPNTFVLAPVPVETGKSAQVPEQSTEVGTSGTVASYELTPQEGVELSAHVGHRVEITALMLDPASKGDDDAKVKVKSKTKVKTDDAPDQKVKSKTKAELARGPMPRLAVTTVKHIAPSCTM